MEKIKHAIYKDGRITTHRPPLKVWTNNFLRLAQFWTKNKYVIASIFDNSNNLVGYSLQKTEHKYYFPRRHKEDAKT